MRLRGWRPPFSLALALSAGGHLVAAAVLHGLSDRPPPPAPAPLDLSWVDLTQLAMPGTGTDLLAGGPGGLPGPPGAAAPATELAPTPAQAGAASAAPAPADDAVAALDIDPAPGSGPTALRVPATDPEAAPPGQGPRAADRRAAVRRLLVHTLAQGGANTGGSPGAGPGGGSSGPYWGTGTTGGQGLDGVMVRWLQVVHAALQQHFHPLPVTLAAHPDARVSVLLRLDVHTGAVTGAEVLESSGVASFDAAGVAAVRRVAVLPPPPTAWRGALAHGMVVHFEAQEVRVGGAPP